MPRPDLACSRDGVRERIGYRFAARVGLALLGCAIAPGQALAFSVNITSGTSITFNNNGSLSQFFGDDAFRVATPNVSVTTLNNYGSIVGWQNGIGFAFRVGVAIANANQNANSLLVVNNYGRIHGGASSGTAATIVNNYGNWEIGAQGVFGRFTVNNSGTITVFESNYFRDSQSAVGSITSLINDGTVDLNAALRVADGYVQNSGATTLAGQGRLIGTVILNGGVFRGSGGIEGELTINAGATVAPGNMTVTGNVTFNSGSTYSVLITGGSASSLYATGTAALDGTIQVVAGGGSYNFGTPYTVLTASGGVTGTFGRVTTEGSFGDGIKAFVNYTSDSVFVTLNPGSLLDFASSGVGGAGGNLSLNGYSVAAAIDRAVTGGADPSFLYKLYASIDRQALAEGLRTLTGEIHAGVGTLGLTAASGFLTATLDPFAAGRDPGSMPNAAGAFATPGSYASSGSTEELPAGKSRAVAPRFVPDRSYTAWGQVFGSASRGDGDVARGVAARDGSSGHVALGVDLRVLPETVVGVAVAAGEARTNLSGNLGDAKADIFQAGLYGMTRIGALSLGAALGYASADIETKRAVPVLGTLAVKGDYRADIWSGRAEASYRLFALGPASLSPYGALTAQSLRTPAFIERDGVTGLPTGLAVAARTGTTVRTELGLRLDAATILFGTPATVFGKLGWGYYAKADARFSASLIGLPGSGFSFDGARPDRNAALISAGLDVRVSPTVVLGARFDSELSSSEQSYAGAATLKVSF